MDHEKAMESRQRREHEARKRLASRGIHEPRNGGVCDFELVRKYDMHMEAELFKLYGASI